MKILKIIIIYLTLFIFVIVLSSCKSATVDDIPKTKDGFFYYNILSYREQVLFDEITTAIENFKNSTSAIKLSYSDQEFNNVIDAIICDNPMLFYADFGKFELNVEKEKTVVNISYYDEESDIKNKISYVNNAIEKIVGELNLKDESISEIEKEILIHDYIVARFSQIATHETTDEEMNLYTAFKTEKSNALGYASIFKILMNEADIECYIVQGIVANNYHVWNMAKVEDKFYFVDVLFNDYDGDVLDNLIFHAYFNLGYEKISRDHNFNQAHLYKDINNIYTYYDYKNLYANDRDKLHEILYTEIKKLITDGKTGNFNKDNKDAFEIYSDLSDDIFDDVIYNVIAEINAENDALILKEQYRLFNTSNVLNAQCVQIFYE